MKIVSFLTFFKRGTADGRVYLLDNFSFSYFFSAFEMNLVIKTAKKEKKSSFTGNGAGWKQML